MAAGQACLKNRLLPAVIHCLMRHENTIKHRARDRLYKDFPAGYHTLGGLLCRPCPGEGDPQPGGHRAHSIEKGTDP